MNEWAKINGNDIKLKEISYKLWLRNKNDDKYSLRLNKLKED